MGSVKRNETVNVDPIKVLVWAKWKPLVGTVLIVVGLILVNSFVKPYLLYFFAPVPLEASLPRSKSDDRIFIPSIKLSAPLYEGVDRLDYGIVFPFEINLGKGDNTILEGHNLAKNGPLFSLLYLAKADDEIILHYQGRRYSYKIVKSKVIEPKQRQDFIKQTEDERLTLITCYPPASTAMRLVVIAKPI